MADIIPIETRSLAQIFADYDWREREPGQSIDLHELEMCMEYNAAPFAFEALDTVSLVQRGERDGGEWIWDVVLRDGRQFHIVGGCDYTGWDCRSHADYVGVDTSG